MKLLSNYQGKHRRQPTTEEFAAPLCPWCGGFTEYRLICDGFEENGRWWIHQDCDKAVQYYCMGAYEPTPTCTWSYNHGMNMRNPAWGHNENQRPAWIGEGQQVYDEKGESWVAPGVTWRGDR